MENEQDEPIKAKYFATVDKGIIVTICESTPPHELLPNQFILTKEEYGLLEVVRGKRTPAEIIRLAKAIAAKIKANGN